MTIAGVVVRCDAVRIHCGWASSSRLPFPCCCVCALHGLALRACVHAGTLGAKKKTSGKIYAAEMTSQGRSTGTTADNAVQQTRGMGLPIAKQVGSPRAVWCGVRVRWAPPQVPLLFPQHPLHTLHPSSHSMSSRCLVCDHAAPSHLRVCPCPSTTASSAASTTASPVLSHPCVERMCATSCACD